MKQNEKSPLSDDLLIDGIDESYQFIEEGRFYKGVIKINELMNIDPYYPGLVEGYRTAKFWNNRKDEINKLNKGKQTADYLMTQWEDFKNYATKQNMLKSKAFKVAMKYIFFTASENYKIAFMKHEGTADNYDLLLNLGKCFLTLGEFRSAIETLEYARSAKKEDAKLLAILGEAYFNIREEQKSVLLFREAFFINPTEIDLTLLESKAILDLIDIIKEKKFDCDDVREWIPIFGFLEDIFHTKRRLEREQYEALKLDIYNLERNFQTINKEKIQNSNIKPRLINKYLWMLDYFEIQEYDLNNQRDIKERLLMIDRDLFEGYFTKDK